MTKTMLNDQDLLSRLVAIDTTSELSNGPIIDFISDYLDDPAPPRFDSTRGKARRIWWFIPEV